MSEPTQPAQPQPQQPPQYQQQPPQYQPAPGAPAPQYGAAPQYGGGSPQYGASAPQYGAAPQRGLSPKSWVATLLLSIFLGELGIDRFYLGKVGTGILKLVTLGGFGIWWLIDIILTIAGAATDKQGLVVKAT
ncbi:TM2 domain-containing protein [Microbacterium terregens]|jgi:hypothetical protein|uniref:TM2 domain-containing protein n=1 Tax=Microbacterium terregens TaxID=69363 RepID=A0ABV5SV12_9MICO